MCHADPQALRDRAEELRTIAEDMRDEEAKRQLLRCAEDYEEWAKRLDNPKP